MPGLLDDIGANLGGLFGNLGTATQNFLQSPSIASGIGNAVRGATTGQATDQAGAFQQFQQQVFKTLIANGVEPKRAALAVQNPDELKAVIGQLNPSFEPFNTGNTLSMVSRQTGEVRPSYIAPEFKTTEPGAPMISYQPGLPGQAPARAPIQGSPLAPPDGGSGPMPLPAPSGGTGPMQASPLAPPTGAAGPMPLGGGTQVLSPGLTPTQLTEQRKRGEDLAALGSGIDADVRSAVNQKNVLQRMSQLSPQAFSGPGAPAYQHARAILMSLGIPSSQVPAGEEFSALANKSVIEGLGGSLGKAISEGDRAYMAQAFPSLATTQQGRQQMIEMLTKIADRKIEVGQLAQQYKKGNAGSLEGFDNALAKWSGDHQLFPKQESAPSIAPNAGAINALIKNPNLRDQFDLKFGPGSAAKVLQNAT